MDEVEEGGRGHSCDKRGQNERCCFGLTMGKINILLKIVINTCSSVVIVALARCGQLCSR